MFIRTWTSEPLAFIRGRHLFETRHLLEVLRYASLIQYALETSTGVCIEAYNNFFSSAENPVSALTFNTLLMSPPR